MIKLSKMFSKKSKKEEPEFLYDADPKCEHEILAKYSGIVCKKCGGWFCF